MQEQNRNVRVWRVKGGEAGIMLTPDKITMQSDRNTFISMASGNIGLYGKKISIATSPENISKGILFTEQMGFMQMIPSTVVTCVPNCLINIPGQDLISNLGEGMAMIQGMNNL